MIQESQNSSNSSPHHLHHPCGLRQGFSSLWAWILSQLRSLKDFPNPAALGHGLNNCSSTLAAISQKYPIRRSRTPPSQTLLLATGTTFPRDKWAMYIKYLKNSPSIFLRESLKVIAQMFMSQNVTSALFIIRETQKQPRYLFMCVLSHFSHVWLFVTPWTVARQASLSMGFSRQKYWSGLPFPSPGNFPEPQISYVSYVSYIGRQVLYH